MKKYLLLLAVIISSAKFFAQTAPVYTSLAIGSNVVASGTNSFATGTNVQSIGQGSFAWGQEVKANGPFSIAMGSVSIANESNAIVIGTNSTAKGQCIAIGNHLNSWGYLSMALGSYINNNGKRSAFAIGDENFIVDNFGNDADNQMLMRFKNGYKFHLTNQTLALSISPNGTIGIDQSNTNNGTINSGLIFGLQSGEGIASKRTGGGNQFGLDFYSNFTNRMSITNAGKVGIGTTSPQQMLSIAGSMNIDQSNVNNGNLNSGLTFGSGSGEGIASNRAGGANQYGLDFYGGGINRMCITNGGNVGIGITLPAAKLHVAGNIMASGTITPSDIRYKKDIRPLNNALKTIMSLSAFSYLMRTNEFPQMQFDSRRQLGFIAQDVETVLPELVYTANNGYKAIDYVKIIPLLVESIKEQQKQIDELKKLVADLMKDK